MKEGTFRCKSCGHESVDGVHSCEGFKLSQIKRCKVTNCFTEVVNGKSLCEQHLAEVLDTPKHREKVEIDDILKERGSRYGKFSRHAEICQKLKGVMLDTPSWNELSDSQKQSLEVIADKIARMLNGDPNYKDNWVDIIGYSQLILDELEENPCQGRIVFDDDGTTD